MTSSEKHQDESQHGGDLDRSGAHVWLVEDPCPPDAVLTLDGISQIAHHKYVAGSYTYLDNYLNPFWTYCTEAFLPMSMAPNMVTTIGGLACLLSYIVTWYYLPQFEELPENPVPSWLLVANGFAVFLYYTLDCMDGKQARRTGTSSPLGQLFDHGIDTFANMFMLSVCQSFLMLGPSKAYMWSQLWLQVSFFGAQWEEYHTGILPHSYGGCIGVTETNYALAVAAMANALIDYRSFYQQTVQETLRPFLPVTTLLQNASSPSLFVSIFNGLLTHTLKEMVLVGWLALTTSIFLSSMYRTGKHLQWDPAKTSVAFGKFLSPFLVALPVLFVLPEKAIIQECRLISVSCGLCFVLITIKMIVLSMARMTYACIQIDILPLLGVLAFVTWEYDYVPQYYFDANGTPATPRLKPLGLHFLFQALSVFYVIRIIQWTHTAMHQLCERLDVYIFTIKQKKKD